MLGFAQNTICMATILTPKLIYLQKNLHVNMEFHDKVKLNILYYRP